jgi:hypothetical protein
MAGKKAQGNQHRKRKYEARRSGDIPAKNKKRRWEARVRKLQRKAEKRGVEFNYPFKTLEDEQAASRAACERGRQRQLEQRAEQRAKRQARKQKRQEVETADAE